MPILTRTQLAGLSLLVSLPMAAHAEANGRAHFIRALDRMMQTLAPQSARASRTIRQAYRDHLDLLVLNRYAELEGALMNGGLAPLPPDPRRYNVAPRLTGPYPIGEKDLENQVSYIAARPATIGCLLDVASRVKSGAVEITSLVRHSEYQQALRATNANANTAVPMHTMGLAFDIALVNTPLETVYEIRDVLRRMRDDGQLLFIGERKQLVFHVVPHPSRLGYFTEIYARAVGAPALLDGAHVVAFSTTRGGTRPATHAPQVKAEVIAVVPTSEFAREWWAADHDHADISVEVVPESTLPAAPRQQATAGAERPPLLPLIALFAALLAATWRFVTHRPRLAVLRVPVTAAGG